MKTETQSAQEMQEMTLESAKDIGNVYKAAGNVGSTFDPHYVNMGSDIVIPDARTVKNRHGIAMLIAQILQAKAKGFTANNDKGQIPQSYP